MVSKAARADLLRLHQAAVGSLKAQRERVRIVLPFIARGLRCGLRVAGRRDADAPEGTVIELAGRGPSAVTVAEFDAAEVAKFAIRRLQGEPNATD